jgi:eukaryotic-like serine/threonine-protein kinase
MVHRDIKPANMMLVYTAGYQNAGDTTGATLKLVDFGLSRAIDEVPPPESAQDVNLTVAGALLGTPDYVAPEQARDARSADIRADIYSLGCVGYHLLSGHPPFPDKNAIRQMVRHATEPPAPLNLVRPETPAYLRGVIERMLAKNPADRFATPGEALNAMESLACETRTLQSTPSRADSSDPTRLLAVVDPAPTAPLSFSGADAATAKQAIFTPVTDGKTDRSISSSDTPTDASIPNEFERQLAVTGELPPLADAKAKSAPAEKRPPSARNSGREASPPVPSKSVSRSGIARRSFYWTTRDTLVFAAGAATVLTALGIGALFSWLLHGK